MAVYTSQSRTSKPSVLVYEASQLNSRDPVPFASGADIPNSSIGASEGRGIRHDPSISQSTFVPREETPKNSQSQLVESPSCETYPRHCGLQTCPFSSPPSQQPV